LAVNFECFIILLLLLIMMAMTDLFLVQDMKNSRALLHKKQINFSLYVFNDA
jgi:hypothetical protein